MNAPRTLRATEDEYTSWKRKEDSFILLEIHPHGKMYTKIETHRTPVAEAVKPAGPLAIHAKGKGATCPAIPAQYRQKRENMVTAIQRPSRQIEFMPRRLC